MYKASDGDYIPEKVEFFENFLTTHLGEWDCVEIAVCLPENAAPCQNPKPGNLYIEILEEMDEEIYQHHEINMSKEQERQIRAAYSEETGTIWFEWKATGLFCEGCRHEFLPGELMLMAYEGSDTETQTSFCCDCLAYELAVETAIPEDFIVASPSSREGIAGMEIAVENF